MRWIGHVERMGEMTNAYNISVERTEGIRQHGRARSRWGDCISMEYGLDSSGSGYGPVGGSCEHSNEPAVSIKGREFLD
jgi:hypothetical protein